MPAIQETLRPCAIRKRRDSGNQIISAGLITIGAIPPNQKMASHPYFVRINEFRNPPDITPNGNADQIKLATIARRRLGASSDANARKQGVAPPSPMPVQNRIASKLQYEGDR